MIILAIVNREIYPRNVTLMIIIIIILIIILAIVNVNREIYEERKLIILGL